MKERLPAKRIPSPILTLTESKESNTLPVITGFKDVNISSHSTIGFDTRQSCLAEVIQIELSGAFQPGTTGENRQVFYEKLIDFSMTEPDRYRHVKYLLKYSPSVHDNNAIEVLFKLEDSPRNNYSLGYIPRTCNETLLDYVSNYNKKYYKNIEKFNIDVIQIHSSSTKSKTEFRCSILIELNKKYYDLFPVKSRISMLGN
jgi:hypothetical protein